MGNHSWRSHLVGVFSAIHTTATIQIASPNSKTPAQPGCYSPWWSWLGVHLSRERKATFTWKCLPTHGPNWEVKVFLLQVTYAIIFHQAPASLICSALWPLRGKDWFASPKWIMIQWLEPMDRLDSDQTTATPCSTHTHANIGCWSLWSCRISPYLYMANWNYIWHIPDNLGEWINGAVHFLMRSVPLWSKNWLSKWVDWDPPKQTWKRKHEDNWPCHLQTIGFGLSRIGIGIRVLT